jgi:hypothetical protein
MRPNTSELAVAREPGRNTFNTRYRVADGLALTGRLKGMTRSEVVALLGPPPPADKFDDHGLVYVLGRERSWISLDYE